MCFALLLCLGASVSCKNYDAEFDKLEQRIAALKEADKETRRMVIAEMDRLALEIQGMLQDLENRVLERLDKKVTEVERKIIDDMSGMHDRITVYSHKLGADITSWDQSLKSLVASRTSDFNAATSLMEKELDKAIKSGDAALQKRIRIGMDRLSYIQKNVPSISEKVQKRFDGLSDIEELYGTTSTKVAGLRKIKETLDGRLDQYQDIILDLISSDLDEFASSELQEYYETVAEAYSDANSLMDDLESMYSELESAYDDMPDLDALLDEASALVDMAYDLEDGIYNFDMGDVESILEEINAIHSEAMDMELADMGELETLVDEIHDMLEDFAGWMDDVAGAVYYAADALNIMLMELDMYMEVFD